jgi:deoxyribodipyrimidine photolyase-related protein
MPRREATKKPTLTDPQATIWLLEDHLSEDLPLLKAHPTAAVLIIESRKAFAALPFHQRRLTFIVSAMRHFARRLRDAGREVHLYTLSDTPYRDSLSAIRDWKQRTRRRTLLLTEPNDHHTMTWVQTLPALLDMQIVIEPRGLMLTDRRQFSAWATKLKSPVMEHFYRRMRREHNVLMQGDEPVGGGGAWNFDKENRKTAKAAARELSEKLFAPKRPSFAADEITRAAHRDVQRVFSKHPGGFEIESFDLPVTREQALKVLRHFIEHRLPRFGDYQDVMLAAHPTMDHALISAPLNLGLLTPMEVIKAAEKAHQQGHAPLNCVEGFIRQILGWREYVFGIYWSFMPEYLQRNALKAGVPLPEFFWTGKTKMNCVRSCVKQAIDTAYNHHIQRLMVLGNFAALAGLEPKAVNDWFLSMFIDSHDWVMAPNVIGMALHADGATMGTKPYVSTAAYIDRMTDACAGCAYDPKQRLGERACPFNTLFWTFLDQHKAEFNRNPRMSMMLKNLDRVPPAELKAMHTRRAELIRRLESGV